MATSPGTITFQGAFPTAYAPSSDCNALSSNSVVGLDFAISCLPKNFNQARNAYYSPGTGCPSGYTAQNSCTRSTGTETTTITCCPVRDQITMWCAENPSSLVGDWENLMCTWSAGAERRIFQVTSSQDGGATVYPVTMEGGDGINAYGLKMVYASSDLATSTSSATATSGATTTGGPLQTSSQHENTNTSSGLSKGAIIGIAVAVPLACIAALIALFVWYRRRKQQYGTVGPNEHSEMDSKGTTPNATLGGYNDPQNYSHSDVAPSELGTDRAPQELPSDSFTSELPAEVPRAH